MTLDLGFYWALLLRRLPVMILFFLLFSGMGLVAALKLPDVYSTSARLLVEEPLIPDNMVSSTVRISAVEQLEIIEQRLLTRANLIDIANRFDVFEDIRDMEPDTVLTAMQNATTIRRTRNTRGGGDGATLMAISFKSHSPQIAASVVNEYVTLVLDENARFRASRAENTLEFFEQEVDRLNNDLDSQSTAIALFKAENANALPQDQAYRLGRQTLLQERLGQLEQELKTLEQKRENLVEAFEARKGLAPQPVVGPRSAFSQQLMVSKAELEHLRDNYADDNPRIIRLKNRIDRLEAIVEAENTAVSPAGETEEEISPDQVLLEVSLSEIDSEAASLRAAIENTSAELDKLQQNISRSASNALQLAELEREYDIIQTRYSSAVSNLNTARMSERLEATAQGQRITVIENASVPRVPSGPDRTLIAALAIFGGLALAVGYFFLLEVLNRVVRRPAELAERFDTEPIATIPYMESRRERMLRRTGMITATLAALIAVPVGLWYVDTYYLPLEIIVQRGLEQLGLG